MASTRKDLYHHGRGGSHLVPSGSKVVLSRFYENGHGHLAVLFRVDDQDNSRNELEVSDSPRSVGTTIAELADCIRFDSDVEHLAFQQALTAHHLGNIAVSLGNMEEYR